MSALTKDGLCEKLFEELGFKRCESKEFVDVLFEEMRLSLEENEDLKLANFGNFSLRNKSARPGRNPRTGEPALIKPRRVVTFKASAKVQEEVESFRPESG